MKNNDSSQYRAVTISGKVAAGTSTLAKNLKEALGWKYINAGEIQRQYDREHGIDEKRHGAEARPDDHEREIETMTKKMLETETGIVYEAWLAGFIAQGVSNVFKVLLICSDEAVKIDRVVNRDRMTVDEAKEFIKKREEENKTKWQKLYGNYDFWDPKYYDLVLDTYATGPMETLGKVLDKLNSKK